MVTLLIRLLVAISHWRFGPPRVIDRSGKKPYIVRYYLIGGDKETGRSSTETRWYSRFFSELFLQHFKRSDDTWQLHNHPWRWAGSIILRRGYLEERRSDKTAGGAKGDHVTYAFHSVYLRAVRWYNFLRHDTFHRVELDRGEAWTLFLAGPKVQDWGFWNRSTGKYTPHELLEDDGDGTSGEKGKSKPVAPRGGAAE